MNRLQILMRGCGVAALTVAALLFTTDAKAFKIQTHVASANRTLDQLAGKIDDTKTLPDTLVFDVAGRRFELQVSVKEAYVAIQKQPAFFRGGVIGPDAFPDIFMGQGYLHGNQNLKAGELTETLTQGVVKALEHDLSVPLEDRNGVSQLRSVDHAMALLEHLQNGGYAFRGEERQQALAFIMGFFSHGVGDSFAHAWVNQYAGGAWAYEAGHGLFGWETEELKHVAIEGLIDARVPGVLQNINGQTGGALDRMDVRAPVAFLDSFFSKQLANALSVGNRNGDYEEFLTSYRNLDQLYGGPTYAFFNLQVDAADKLVNWTNMKPFLAWVARHQEGTFTSGLLDTVDWPAQRLEDLQDFVQGDLLDFVSGGYVRCDIFPDATSLEALRATWGYLGQFLARASKFKTKAMVVRQNWLRLSECTAQNLARLSGDPWDPANPTKNRDACAELADKPWSDETSGDGTGLWRGSIREGDEDDAEFLRDLKAYFRGSGDDKGVITLSKTLEQKSGVALNDHRKFGPNISRQKNYLLGFAFILDDLEDVIITDSHESTLAPVCDAVQQDSKRRCLNGVVVTAAAAVAGTVTGLAECGQDYWNCRKDALDECLHSLCSTACKATGFSSPRRCVLGGRLCVPAVRVGFPCDSVCAGVQSSCEAVAGKFCTIGGASIKIPFVPRIRIPSFDIPGCKSGVHDFCRFAGGHEGDCTDTVLPICEAKAAVNCPTEVLRRVKEYGEYGELLVKGIHNACNLVDQARTFIKDYDTPVERRDFLRRHGVPLDEIERLIAIQGAISDKLRAFPPETAVNAVFLQEDLREDASYAAVFYANLVRSEAQGNALPEGPSKRLRLAAVARMRWVADMALQGHDAPVLDLRDTSGMTLAQLDGYLALVTSEMELFKEAIDMGAIPVAPGPTVKRVLADVGADFVNSFTPFFNAVQGMKLVPLVGRVDIERMAQQQPGNPWNEPSDPYDQHPPYSELCRSLPLTSVYCDAMPSFDDPTCMNCSPGADTTKDARGWVRGRGIVLADGCSHQLSPVVVGNTEVAYDAQYRAVFRVPGCNDAPACTAQPVYVPGGTSPVLTTSSLAGLPTGPSSTWQRTLVGAGSGGYLQAAVAAPSGGVTVVGSENIGSGARGVVITLNADGSERWRTTLAPTGTEVVLTSAAATRDGAVVVAGSIAPLTDRNNKADVLVAKVTGGVVSWTRQFGTANRDIASAITETKDGGLFVAGEWAVVFANDGTPRDAFAVGLNADGSERCAPQTIVNDVRVFSSVAEDCGGGLVGAGWVSYADQTVAGFMARFGGPMLSYGVDWADSRAASVVRPASDWGTVVLANQPSGAGFAGTIRKVDVGGTTAWVRTYPQSTGGRAMVRYGEGYLLGLDVAGSVASSELALVAVDSNGVPQWLSPVGNRGEYIRGIAVTTDGGIAQISDNGARMLR